MDIIVILHRILEENGFSAAWRPLQKNITATRSDEGSLTRYVIVEDSKASPTRKKAMVRVAWPMIDQGEDTTAGHDVTEIEFAEPGSIDKFIGFINAKLV